jgi:three-Cys-motif partner protein
VNCVFIDEKGWIADHCRKKLVELPANPRVKHQVLEGRFSEVLPKLVQEYPRHFQGDWPLFVFADPFGATGVPFASVKQILATDRSELFLNFDSDGLIRILKAGGADEKLTEIFGDDSWRGELPSDGAPLALARRALSLFKRRLRSIEGVDYVFAFEMQKHQGNPDYHLIFASKHRLGLEKMKEAMRRIAEGQGGFEFCDATAGTESLFRFDLPEDWARVVHSEYAGRTVPAEAVWDFVLNETLLVNAKRVLDRLEKENWVTIQRKPGAGKQRGLDSMLSITFKPGQYDPAGASGKGLFDGT